MYVYTRSGSSPTLCTKSATKHHSTLYKILILHALYKNHISVKEIIYQDGPRAQFKTKTKTFFHILTMQYCISLYIKKSRLPYQHYYLHVALYMKKSFEDFFMYSWCQLVSQPQPLYLGLEYWDSSNRILSRQQAEGLWALLSTALKIRSIPWRSVCTLRTMY